MDGSGLVALSENQRRAPSTHVEWFYNCLITAASGLHDHYIHI